MDVAVFALVQEADHAGTGNGVPDRCLRLAELGPEEGVRCPGIDPHGKLDKEEGKIVLHEPGPPGPDEQREQFIIMIGLGRVLLSLVEEDRGKGDGKNFPYHGFREPGRPVR